jgi:hypothetical protein
METLLENYFNGNLEDAKRQGLHFGMLKIYDALRHKYNFNHEAAYAVAMYLKGKGTFQAAATAELKDRREQAL